MAATGNAWQSPPLLLLCRTCKMTPEVLAVCCCLQQGNCAACNKSGVLTYSSVLLAAISLLVNTLSTMAPCSLEHATLATHAQVKSGAFVSSDRDAALTRMIDAASVRYSPEQEQALLQDPAAAAQPAGGAGAHGLARLSASLMRKISLSSVSTARVCVILCGGGRRGAGGVGL